MTRYLTADNEAATSEDDSPDTDNRDVRELIPEAVEEILSRAGTWLAWDGRAVYADGNAWTPHKALRRVTDHLIDHLTELECRRAGLASPPDQWHGRRLTFDADFARFTEAELDEATSRLRRLALCYRAHLSALTDSELDAAASTGWTIRQIVHHVANVTYYARCFDGQID